MPYYFGPYVQDKGSWRPPVTVEKSGDYFAGIPLPARNGTPWGIFATHATISDASYTALGNWGDPARAAMRDVLRNAFGRSRGAYTGTPQTLGEAILDAWQSWSDPEGLSAPKPLIPAKGKLTLSLGQTLDIPWTWGDLGTSRIQSVIHADRRYYAAEVAAGRMTREKAGQILAADMRRLKASAAVLVLAGVDITPVRPRTSYSDDFNRADNVSSLGGDWTVVWGTSLGILNNRVVSYNSGVASYNFDVSSVDHWSELEVFTTGTYGAIGPCVRCNGDTFYRSQISTWTNSSTIAKIVAGGIPTDLASVGSSPSPAGTLRFGVSGSTLDLLWNGSSILSVSNSDLTTGSRGGVWAFSNGSAIHPAADSWLVDDGIEPEETGRTGYDPSKSTIFLMGF